MAEGLKFYDALDDEYSTYYFANPTVKKHLKHFSKVYVYVNRGCQKIAQNCWFASYDIFTLKQVS